MKEAGKEETKKSKYGIKERGQASEQSKSNRGDWSVTLGVLHV